MPETAIPHLDDRGSGPATAGTPVDLQMRFACETLTDFLDQHAGDVSRGGIFVRTRELLAVGCPVNLNLQLGNGVTLLAGTATVFWTRANDPAGAESEPGMGLRFGRMTKHSQDVLSFILAEKARRERVADVADDGASEFDDVRTVVVPGDAPPAASDPEDGAGEFGDVRTVVAKEEAPPPAAGVVEGTASAEVEGAPAAAAAKDLQPPVASQSEAPPAPASARTPPPPASPAATP